MDFSKKNKEKEVNYPYRQQNIISWKNENEKKNLVIEKEKICKYKKSKTRTSRPKNKKWI